MEAIEVFPCERCRKNFPYINALRRHSRICGGSDNSYICQFCKKKLKTKISLKCHMRRCQNSKNKFWCNICKATVTENINLDQHMHMKHGITTISHFGDNKQKINENDMDTTVVTFEESETSNLTTDDCFTIQIVDGEAEASSSPEHESDAACNTTVYKLIDVSETQILFASETNEDKLIAADISSDNKQSIKKLDLVNNITFKNERLDDTESSRAESALKLFLES